MKGKNATPQSLRSQPMDSKKRAELREWYRQDYEHELDWHEELVAAVPELLDEIERLEEMAHTGPDGLIRYVSEFDWYQTRAKEAESALTQALAKIEQIQGDCRGLILDYAGNAAVSPHHHGWRDHLENILKGESDGPETD
jgi:hypothetical protein